MNTHIPAPSAKLILIGAGVAFFIVVFGLVGREDMKDEIRTELAYCAGVKDGSWPDYRHEYAAECTAANIEKISAFLK